MSSWPDNWDRRKSGNGKAPEPSNVAQTCNRLSQFLREKGSLRDLGFGIAGRVENKGRTETSDFTATTRNLFSNMEKLPDEVSEQHELMNLFPLSKESDAANKAISSKMATIEKEPKTAQMTIFYGGQLFVFNDVSADVAGELMQFATKESHLINSCCGFLPTPRAENIKSPIDSAQKHLQPQPKPTGSGPDLPIARRASLHRFLDKRKDRVTATAPYQVHGKHKERFDLNLE